MSTTAAYGQIDISSTEHVPMSRLARVELRKALDTRAGLWFAVSIIALVLVVEVIYAIASNENDRDFGTFLSIAGGVLGYFLPILIIMLVTSEASQRNGLVTFTLEPKRSRVVVAKFIAGIVLGILVMVMGAVMAVFGTVVGMLLGGSPEWSVDGNLLFNGFVLANVIGVFIGFAIAMLLMNTPAAIVGYFAVDRVQHGADPALHRRLHPHRRGVGADRGGRHHLADRPARPRGPAAAAHRVQVELGLTQE
jgi:ABC-2 type transport system permease protein